MSVLSLICAHLGHLINFECLKPGAVCDRTESPVTAGLGPVVHGLPGQARQRRKNEAIQSDRITLALSIRRQVVALDGLEN
jgi:hypothetical protein